MNSCPLTCSMTLLSHHWGPIIVTAVTILACSTPRAQSCKKNIHTHFTLLADHSTTLLVGLLLYTWMVPYLPREEYRRLVQRYPEGRHHHQLKQQPQQQGHHADQQNRHQNTLRGLKIDSHISQRPKNRQSIRLITYSPENNPSQSIW